MRPPVSIGGVQSDQTRQVAAVAAHLGLACVLVRESWVDRPDSVYDVGTVLISRLAGADVRLAATIDLVRSHEIAPTSTVLHARLGGQPALNAYSALVAA